MEVSQNVISQIGVIVYKMFTKFCIKWLTRPSTHIPRFFFSNPSKILQETLQKIKVEVDGKNTGILDSGMIVGQQVD